MKADFVYLQPIVSAMYGAGSGGEQESYGSHDEL